MNRARRAAAFALLGAAIALAGCMSDPRRTEAQEASSNAARTIQEDLQAAEARGAAAARTSIAEADAELDRQLRSTAGSEPAYKVQPSDIERNAR